MDWRRWFRPREPAHGTREKGDRAGARSSARSAEVSLEEIRRSFDEAAANEEQFPASIDPRIYHVRLIVEFFAPLERKRLLDIGCGKGRFARVLQEEYPEARVTGVDLSEAMLAFVPREIGRCSASMTSLPFAEGAFDGAYATESLEHAVDIEAAVAEMCRAVRPGGRVVIIDKNAEQWGRLQTPRWEKWFRREELERLLRHHCREVSSEFISYWEDVPPDGLFIAWKAVK
ncbi:MAG: methyltransferase domain-containing protein [Acidobacteria bacterium]|nr:methyltransferase domain-containing protein [Acidobacteriota bacterium]